MKSNSVSKSNVRESSLIASSIQEGSDLKITFKSGKVYRYIGAGSLQAELADAPSQGQFFHGKIKNKFGFEES